MKKVLASFILLTLANSAFAATTTGRADCDQLVKKNAAILMGFEAEAASLVTITNMTVVKSQNVGMGTRSSMRVQFVNAEVGAGGSTQITATPGGCFMKSIIIDDVEW